MRKLEKKLQENKIKEEKEAQDLEAMVQHVEQNLQLMTVSVGFRFRSDVRRNSSCEGGKVLHIPERSSEEGRRELFLPPKTFRMQCGVTQTISLQVLCWHHSFPHSSSCLVCPQHPVVSIISVLLQKRAAKAENIAAKLRQENAQLQVQHCWGCRDTSHYWATGKDVARGFQVLKKMFSGSVKA